MSGTNGGTQVPYSFVFEFSLVCFLYITFAPMVVFGYPLRTNNSNQTVAPPGGSEVRKSSSMAYFDEVPGREIEVIEGQTVVIPCTVRKLSREKVVSWIRTRDIHILTSGPHTFSSDYRFEVVHNDRDEDFWGLRIRGVEAEDTGQYECQVNTEPKMSLAYKLIVSSLGSDDDSKWMGYAKIHEPKEVFVQHGSPFYLSCEVSLIFAKNINYDVWWLHEDNQILFQLKDSRISIQTSYKKENNILYSILSFDYITWQDGGLYTCLQPSVRKDSVKLIVVEAESSEAMQRDFPLSSDSNRRSTCFLSTNILLMLIIKVFHLMFF